MKFFEALACSAEYPLVCIRSQASRNLSAQYCWSEANLAQYHDNTHNVGDLVPPLHDGGEVSVGLLAAAHGPAVPDGAVVVTQRPLLEGGVQARAADRALAQLLTSTLCNTLQI